MSQKKDLVYALTRLLGNKVYLKDIEGLIKDESLMTPQEKQSLRYLIQDINQVENTTNSNSKKFGRPF